MYTNYVGVLNKIDDSYDFDKVTSISNTFYGGNVAYSEDT